MKYETLNVFSHIDQDGIQTRTVSRWPERILLSGVVLDNAKPWVIETQGNRVTVHMANGDRTYRIVGDTDGGRTVACELMA